MSDWTAHAAELARSIGAVAPIRDRRWLAAVEQVPRHLFVPRWYERSPTGWVAAGIAPPAAPDPAAAAEAAGDDAAATDPTGGSAIGQAGGAEPEAAAGTPATGNSASVDGGSVAVGAGAGAVTEAGLAGAYRDEALVTALLPDGHGGLAAVSSSTQPSLMVGMLDALDLGNHPRVLEIGTGTGYNAALMCHVLGDAAVHSVDVDPALVDTARARLDSLGHHPLLAVGDGRAGLPGHAPYDRIIATCAFPEVPWAWAEQLVAGGLLLVDVKVGLLAGNLALLRRTPDRLEGRFLPAWAGFMAVRDRDRPPVWQEADPPVGPTEGETETALDPHPLAASVPWFLAQIGLPPVVTFRRFGPDLAGARFVAADGAWCAVSPPDTRGRRSVTWGGPRCLWDDVERAHALWRAHRRPSWDRIGLTVTPDRTHTVWLDRPDAPLARW
ncbi:MAG TPA: methyltransferase domain-containing protein [Pseudonocardia sp.]|nr:methyltransferase domain-containing protein [Pseudonocardia sp.]